MYSKHKRNVANVKSQVKIYFTGNKVSGSCACSDFNKLANLAEPTNPTFQKQIFSNPDLPSALTQAEILFAMGKKYTTVVMISQFYSNCCSQIGKLHQKYFLVELNLVML